MSSAVIDGKFYAIGGSDGSTQLDSMEIYDPATNSWTQGPSLPRKSTSACSVEWNGKILYLVEGMVKDKLTRFLSLIHRAVNGRP